MRKETISLLQNDFLAFARMALSKLDGTVIDDDRYVELYATYLMKFADWSINRLVVNMPPRHGKSKLGSVCCTAWILAHNPRAKIMIVTYAKDLAQNISRAIRDVLESPWFRAVFPTRVSKTHRKSSNFATTAGGEVYATSFDGSLDRVRWGHHHCRRRTQHRGPAKPRPTATDHRSISLDSDPAPQQSEERSHHGRGSPCARERSLCRSPRRRWLGPSRAADYCAARPDLQNGVWSLAPAKGRIAPAGRRRLRRDRAPNVEKL